MKGLNIAILILLVILLFQCSCQKQGSPEQAPLNQQPLEDPWLLYADSTGGYFLSYPPNWTLRDHAYKQEMIRADLFYENLAGLQIRMLPGYEKDQDLFTEEYLQNFIKEMESHHRSEMREIERLTVTGSGIPYRKIVLQAQHETGEIWLFLQYIWPHSGNYLVFQSGVLEADRERFESQLDEIAASLQFRNQ